MSDESSFSNFYGINLNKDFDRFGNIYFNSLISFSSSGNKKNSFIADDNNVAFF